MQLTKEQVEERVRRLKEWCDHTPEGHYMYSSVKKELNEYINELADMDLMGVAEIKSKVPTQFYGQLDRI